MDYCIAKLGQQFECNFKRFKEEIEDRKLFLEHDQNIFIFSFLYCCSYLYFIMQNSRSLKETFDYGWSHTKEYIKVTRNGITSVENETEQSKGF